MDVFDSHCEEDAEFLHAVAAAEASSGNRMSARVAVQDRESRLDNLRQDNVYVEPAESVSSSFPGSQAGVHSRQEQAVDVREISSKRSKVEPEGEYMAALRGTHSETWQAMSSKMRPESNSRYGASSFPPSLVTGFDNSGSQGGSNAPCFLCGEKGHWMRDCPTKSINANSWRPESTNVSGQAEVPEKGCPCGGGICRVLTANTEKNAGRQFYRCPLRQEEGQCGFFEWCDSSTTTSYGTLKDSRDGQKVHSEFPCPCGAGPCITLTAKTEKNMGRQFYRCPLNQGEGSCGFFKWCDEALPASSATPAYGGSPFKERAPISNVTTGQCYKCGKDGHWAKDCSFTAQNTPPKGFPITAQSIPASGTTGSCFKCGQEGHWARDCQNQQSGLLSKASAGFDRHRTDANSSTGLPNVGGFGNAGAIHQTTGAFGTMNSDTCFKCGSQGHWSKDCPAMRSGSYGGVQSQGLYSGRSTGSSKSCFKCGGQGHWANECRPYGKG